MTNKTGFIPAIMELVKIMIGDASILATYLADADYKEDKWILQYTVFTRMTKSWDPFMNRTNGMGMGESIQ